jgi:ABC-type branched-subunit amino acid transport system substrate-binding protein
MRGKSLPFKKSSGFVLVMLLATAMLAACGDATATPAPAATTAAATTAATTAAATTAAATSAAAATTAAAGTTAASGTPWVNTPGKVPDNLKTDVGVDATNKTIKMGAILDLTGPASNGGKLASRDFRTYYKGVNDRGGIDGFKVVYSDYDSQYSPQVAVQQYNKASSELAMITGILGTPVLSALQPQIDQDKMPTIALTFASKWSKDPNMLIGGGLPYRVELLNTVDYVVNKLGKKSPKIAFVYQDDSLGQDMAVAFDVAIKTYGVQDAGRIPYKASDKDFTAQATALKNSGAEFVWIAGLYNQVQQIISTTYSLGFSTTYMLPLIGWDPSMMNTGAKDAVKGALVPVSAPTWAETDKPIIAQLLADNKKFNPNEPENFGYTNDYFAAMLTHIILKKALENGDATRAGILNALNSLQNVDVLGFLPPISLGANPNQRIVSRSLRMGTPDATSPSKIKIITDFFTGEAIKNYDFANAPDQ